MIETVMETQQRLDLEVLYEAIEARNHEKIQFQMKRLLQRMTYYVALTVPLERLQAFLPRFEAAYPDEVWVRKLLLMVTNYGKGPQNDIAEMALQHDFTAPGVGNFLKAIYDLTQAMQDSHTPEARVGYLTSATVNVVMAELAASWYGERPKAWEKVREEQYQPETQAVAESQTARIAYIFWTHPDTVALDEQLWTTIAEGIREKLTRLAETSSR